MVGSVVSWESLLVMDAALPLVVSISDLVPISIRVLCLEVRVVLSPDFFVLQYLCSSEVSFRTDQVVCVFSPFKPKLDLEVIVHFSLRIGSAICTWCILTQVQTLVAKQFSVYAWIPLVSLEFRVGISRGKRTSHVFIVSAR